MATKSKATTNAITFDELVTTWSVTAEFKNPRTGKSEYEDVEQKVDQLDPEAVPAFLNSLNADSITIKVYVNAKHDERGSKETDARINLAKKALSHMAQSWGFQGNVIDKDYHSKAGDVLLMCYKDSFNKTPSIMADFSLELEY